MRVQYHFVCAFALPRRLSVAALQLNVVTAAVTSLNFFGIASSLSPRGLYPFFCVSEQVLGLQGKGRKEKKRRTPLVATD
ncbi:hypothetical protein DFP73DRAFT_534506 [Morchella snyderi]|nr:hypothetical protein DFP73DRAFT_534506 [Morchella snyderi]